MKVCIHTAPGTGDIPRNGLRLGRDAGLWVGPARGAHGWSELCGDGDQPCCGVTHGPEGLKWGPGTWAGWGVEKDSEGYSWPQDLDSYKQTPQWRA